MTQKKMAFYALALGLLTFTTSVKAYPLNLNFSGTVSSMAPELAPFLSVGDSVSGSVLFDRENFLTAGGAYSVPAGTVSLATFGGASATATSTRLAYSGPGLTQVVGNQTKSLKGIEFGVPVPGFSGTSDDFLPLTVADFESFRLTAVFITDMGTDGLFFEEFFADVQLRSASFSPAVATLPDASSTGMMASAAFLLLAGSRQLLRRAG